MYPVKPNVLQTIALLKAWGIKHVVVSPGSRNAPLTHCFSQDTFFDCRVVLDERDAAFKAIGIIQALLEPVVLCCTSGSALLNYGPAVAEAWYQKLPLLIISADRPAGWIGQMDGQTLPQPGAYGSLVKRSVTLPEIPPAPCEPDAETIWHCNRLLNEALIACTGSELPNNNVATGLCAPVQINIPLAEPLFDYSAPALPKIRRIKAAGSKLSMDTRSFAARFAALPARLIIAGQMFRHPALSACLAELANISNCVVLAEHLGNCRVQGSKIIGNFDSVLSALQAKRADTSASAKGFTPDLVISLGGQLVSKRLKHFLRAFKPKEHWLLSPSGEISDVFQSLTDLLCCDPCTFLEALATELPHITEEEAEEKDNFRQNWLAASLSLGNASDLLSSELPLSDISALGSFMEALSEASAHKSCLHLANSSAVRNAQLFNLPPDLEVYCNRGTSGIEGSLATAIGFASATDATVYLAIGDLSFFYGLNGLWNMPDQANLRIFLLNNGGGGIFHTLPGLKDTASLKDFVAGGHKESAEAWAKAAGLDYTGVNTLPALRHALKTFTKSDHTGNAKLLEVFIDMDSSTEAFTDFYRQLGPLTNIF